MLFYNIKIKADGTVRYVADIGELRKAYLILRVNNALILLYIYIYIYIYIINGGIECRYINISISLLC
jgi:hypothetical protein